ncbi:MAG: cobalamin-dependent protein [Peptococcaceae bacterium]|nr:cobalamin-dependent protein [Peptococcaceae bacterium]
MKDLNTEAAKAGTDELVAAIANGENIEAVVLAQKLLDLGLDLETMVEAGPTKALESLSNKCNNDEFCLLEILLAGRAMMDVMEQVVSQHAGFAAMVEAQNRPAFVLGTIKGDMHDLGKNVVAMMLKLEGYRVIDLGKDVEPERFVDAAVKEQAGYIGVSSLITTTIPSVRKVKELAAQAGLTDVKVLAGGAVLRQAEPQQLNVDFVAQSVFHLLRYLRGESEAET